MVANCRCHHVGKCLFAQLTSLREMLPRSKFAEMTRVTNGPRLGMSSVNV
jgi:hypothetical protein